MQVLFFHKTGQTYHMMSPHLSDSQLFQSEAIGAILWWVTSSPPDMDRKEQLGSVQG